MVVKNSGLARARIISKKFFYSAATVTCNRSHLDKVDQSDYRKITIHFKKVGCGKSAARKKTISYSKHKI